MTSGAVAVASWAYVNPDDPNSGFGNAASSDASISADGRYVAFTSDATNLLATADSNDVADVYLRDMQDNTVVRGEPERHGPAVGVPGVGPQDQPQRPVT